MKPTYMVRWAKAAVIYFAVGTSLGLYMSLGMDYRFRGLHAHLNLLGWVSMGVIAALFYVFPALEQRRLTPAYFWLYQIALPMMMTGLFITSAGLSQAVPALLLIALGGVGVWAATVLFGITAFGTMAISKVKSESSRS